jgi:hypothetical protein
VGEELTASYLRRRRLPAIFRACALARLTRPAGEETTTRMVRIALSGKRLVDKTILSAPRETTAEGESVGERAARSPGSINLNDGQ